MENKQDIDFYLKLPSVDLKNCFVENREREFYNILYVGETLSFLLILSHECIWNESYTVMSMEKLFTLQKEFDLFGFVITNSSLDISTNRFKTMIESNYANDIIETLEKWSSFRIIYKNKKAEFKNPISSLKSTIFNIIDKNNTRFI
jgi:hypothetical protein